MEIVIAAAIGLLTFAGVFLLLRGRTFSVVLGLTLLSYAVNLFIFAMGRLTPNAAPILTPGVSHYADPLPPALVLTAIVIGFATTALVLILAVRLAGQTGSDHVDGDAHPRDDAS